jgi:hypothetical protein
LRHCGESIREEIDEVKSVTVEERTLMRSHYPLHITPWSPPSFIVSSHTQRPLTLAGSIIIMSMLGISVGISSLSLPFSIESPQVALGFRREGNFVYLLTMSACSEACVSLLLSSLVTINEECMLPRVELRMQERSLVPCLPPLSTHTSIPWRSHYSKPCLTIVLLI